MQSRGATGQIQGLALLQMIEIVFTIFVVCIMLLPNTLAKHSDQWRPVARQGAVRLHACFDRARALTSHAARTRSYQCLFSMVYGVTVIYLGMLSPTAFEAYSRRRGIHLLRA
jgi:hypothetical protein